MQGAKGVKRVSWVRDEEDATLRKYENWLVMSSKRLVWSRDSMRTGNYIC